MRADLEGRVAVVTGASAGVGRAVAQGLAARGARVVMAVRNPEKGARVRREIVAATGNEEVELLVVDLASQASVRRACGELGERHPALHVLVNNAGVWLEKRQESPDGIEATWAINVLGYHLLTHGPRGGLGHGPVLREAGRASLPLPRSSRPGCPLRALPSDDRDRLARPTRSGTSTKGNPRT